MCYFLSVPSRSISVFANYHSHWESYLWPRSRCCWTSSRRQRWLRSLTPSPPSPSPGPSPSRWGRPHPPHSVAACECAAPLACSAGLHGGAFSADACRLLPAACVVHLAAAHPLPHWCFVQLKISTLHQLQATLVQIGSKAERPNRRADWGFM